MIAKSLALLPNLALTPPTTRLNEALLTPHTGGSGKTATKSSEVVFPAGSGSGAGAGVVVVVVVVEVGGASGMPGRGQQTWSIEKSVRDSPLAH